VYGDFAPGRAAYIIGADWYRAFESQWRQMHGQGGARCAAPDEGRNVGARRC